MSYLNEDSPIASGGEKKKYKRWSKEVRADDMTKRIEVEEVSNGYIITIEKYGDVDGKYVSECTKKISKQNPFEKESEEDESDEDEGFDGLMGSANNSLSGF